MFGTSNPDKNLIELVLVGQIEEFWMPEIL